MKRRVLIGLLLLLALSACHKAVETHHVAPLQPIASPELSAIDSLTWELPDSALVLLLPYFDTCRDVYRNVSTTHDRHYAHLLLAELLYKNDYAQTNREELLQAVDYYDSVTAGIRWADTRGADTRGASLQREIFLAARAHYMNGVGCYETDSVLDACKEYMKAVETMEEWFDEQDLTGKKARFMALAYTHLTILFSDQYLHKQSIYFGKEALGYYNKYNATARHKAWILNEIGSHYDIMNQIDTAYYFYRKGLSVLEDTNNLTYRDIATRMAYLSYRTNGEAKTPMKQMHNLIALSESEREILARYSIIGELFYQEQLFDSAYYYLKEVFDHTERLGLKKLAAKWLMEICNAQGRTEEGSEYAMFLAPFATQNANQSLVKSQLTELYHIYGQDRLKTEHRKHMRKFSKYSGLVWVALAMLTVVSVVLHLVHKKRHRHLKLQNEEKDRQLESERFTHEMKQKALSGRLKMSHEVVRSTLQRLEEQEVALVINENRNIITATEKYEAFLQSQICKEIKEMMNHLHADKRNILKTQSDITEFKCYSLTAQQKALLIKTVETSFSDLYVSLKAKYPSLDRNEWLYCCLYLLKMNKMEVCVLLQDPYYTCRRVTLKLEEAFACRRGLHIFMMEHL